MTLNRRSIQIDGLAVSFWEAGAENPRALLLIHGGLGDARQHWEAVTPALAETFHVLAPDLPGFGESASLPDLTTAHLLDWLEAFLRAVSVDQAVVIGNAVGGAVARLFAAVHPDKAPAIILVNGGAVPSIPPILVLLDRFPPLADWVYRRLARRATQPRMLQQLFQNRDLITDDFVRSARAAVPAYARLLHMLTGSPLPAVTVPPVPTLIMWGAADQFTPPSEGEAIKASIPGSTLTQIAECGHLPPVEAPDVFAWQVNAFLERLSRPAQTPRSGPRLLSDRPGA